MTGSPLTQYSALLHSPNNKRKTYTTSSKGGRPSRPGSRPGGSKKSRTPSPQKPGSAARKLDLSPSRKLDLSPSRKLDLKSPRYFTSPENDDVDYKRHRHRDEPYCPSIKEYPITRQLAVDRMIEERKTSPTRYSTPRSKEKLKSERESVWEARKNEALLDASEIERGILKDILFSETTRKSVRESSISREGAVYKEILTPKRTSPRCEILSPKRTSPRCEIELNDLTIADNNSEVENNPGISPRVSPRDTSISPRLNSVERKDMSSSYKEDDFMSVYRGREDKSINTSPIRWDTPPARRDTTPHASPTRARSPRKASPKKRHSEDTLDTISDLESRYYEGAASPKKVSFSEDTVERNMRIHKLERDVNQRDISRQDLELMEMKHSLHQLNQRLGESETLRIALESEKLRLSLQNITNSPRTPAYNVTSSQPNLTVPQYVTSPAAAPEQQEATPLHVTSPRQHVTSQQQHVTPQRQHVTRVPNVHMGVNLSNACSDITEVNSMIQQMKLENDALKAGLKEAGIRTQQQSKQLEDRLQTLEKERDRIAEENRRYQRLIAQDDKGSRIAMLQRDLHNQMAENEKLKHHLQSLRDNYTKFFGASI